MSIVTSIVAYCNLIKPLHLFNVASHQLLVGAFSSSSIKSV